jgi:hypothetical protein
MLPWALQSIHSRQQRLSAFGHKGMGSVLLAPASRLAGSGGTHKDEVMRWLLSRLNATDR